MSAVLKPVLLTPLGEQDAAVCIDGVCEIPGAAAAIATASEAQSR